MWEWFSSFFWKHLGVSSPKWAPEHHRASCPEGRALENAPSHGLTTAVTPSCPKNQGDSVKRGVQSSSPLPGAVPAVPGLSQGPSPEQGAPWKGFVGQSPGMLCNPSNAVASPVADKTSSFPNFSSPLERADDRKCEPFPEISVPWGGCAGGKPWIKALEGMEGEQRGGRDELNFAPLMFQPLEGKDWDKTLARRQKSLNPGGLGKVGIPQWRQGLTQTGSEAESGMKTAPELSCGVGRSLPVHFLYLWMPKALGRVEVLAYQLEKELQAGPPCSGPQDSEYLPK